MSEEKSRAALLTEVALIFAAIFWGLNFAATKYAADFVPQLFIVAFRFIGGGLLLLLVLRILEPESRLRRKDILPMAALGCFGIGAAQTAFTFGISLTSAASTGLVFTTAPVWGMVLGFVLGLERPSWRGVVGIGLCILGVGVVFYGGLTSVEDSLLGDLVILLAAVCVGAYTVFSMPMLERHSPLAVATYPTLFGGPAILILSLPYLGDVEWGSLGFGPWAALVYSAVLATAFAFAAWQRGISRIGANRVLVYQYLITLTGVTSGIIFFGESLGIEKIVGGAVILLGVYLARRQ
ncbi:MAG: DMT family transporter [Rubrobacter sp.]|nr:DMT family transporter [Rubrobacter sp.]MDQ3638779.1 DMT family transporter [Actinomycetota bacterium]